MAEVRYTRRGLIRSLFHLGSFYALSAHSHALTNEGLALDEEVRKKAKYTLNFASPYDTSLWQSSPHMHREIKTAIEQYSRGEIYVNILDKGIAGIGPKLMARIASGQIHGALVSAANLAPIAPVLDILNIPFWSANNQSYLNLVTSKVWQQAVVDKIQQRGVMEVMFHYVVGARTISVIKPYKNRVLAPEDINNLMVRVPTSPLLENFYTLAGAKTRRIPWGKVAQASRANSFHLLDPSIIGLFNGPDQLKHEIASISEIESVQDSWLAVINQSWLKSLPIHLRAAIKQAADHVFRQQLATYPVVANHCRQGLRELGVKFHRPSTEQLSLWQEACGPDHESWRSFKQSILQDKQLFNRLQAATQVNNGYFI
jgi:TRAP-type C4-dicarboxylate transport system substrate-binding protein